MLLETLAITIHPLQTLKKKKKIEIYFLLLILQNPFWISTVTARNCSGFKSNAISEEMDTKWKGIPQPQIIVSHTNKIGSNKKCSPMHLKILSYFWQELWDSTVASAWWLRAPIGTSFPPVVIRGHLAPSAVKPPSLHSFRVLSFGSK